MSENAQPLLEVSGLTAGFAHDGRLITAFEDVSLTIQPGETLGLAGESGSGKTLTALAILRLLHPPARIIGGSIRFQGRELLALSEEEMRQVRGAGIGLVFQEASAALNPVFRVGDHVAEALVVHGRASWRQARREAVDLLDAVGIPDAAMRARDYPHQISGGMRQRVMIAVALACRPPLVIADEPTSALDVTTQAEILDLLADLRQRFGLSLLLISHDLAVLAQAADRVALMYAGRIVEEGPVRQIFAAAGHPYTRALLASVRHGVPGARLPAIEGTVPSPGAWPPGCVFEPRCPQRMSICREVAPRLLQIVPTHTARCHLIEPPDGDPAARSPEANSERR